MSSYNGMNTEIPDTLGTNPLRRWSSLGRLMHRGSNCKANGRYIPDLSTRNHRCNKAAPLPCASSVCLTRSTVSDTIFRNNFYQELIQLKIKISNGANRRMLLTTHILIALFLDCFVFLPSALTGTCPAYNYKSLLL